MGYQGFEDYFTEPVILSVATTGGLHGKEATPNLPTQPEAVAADVTACEEAGASIVHLHARDEDDADTKSVERFQRLRDAIDERCGDVIVNFTTGGDYPPAQRLAPVLEVEPRPELATIDVGPVAFGQDAVRDYSRAQNETFAERMAEAGVKPELEAFNPGHLTEVNHLIEGGTSRNPTGSRSSSACRRGRSRIRETWSTSSRTYRRGRSASVWPSVGTSSR